MAPANGIGMTTGPGDGTAPPPSLDDVDRAIVGALCEDGRLSMRALAARLHISRASAYVRVQRLEAAGVITGYTARVDPQRYGLGLSAYVYLHIAQPAWPALLTKLIAIREVEHASLVSGDTDIVLLVRTHDIAALRELVLNRFQSMPEVLSTQTVLIFDELGHGPAVPPAAARGRRADDRAVRDRAAYRPRAPPLQVPERVRRGLDAVGHEPEEPAAVPPSQIRWSKASVSSVIWRGTTAPPTTQGRSMIRPIPRIAASG